MNLQEQIHRIQEMMGLISEDKDVYRFSNKRETDKYTTFKGIDLPFQPEYGSEITLIDKNNPKDVYKFIFGKTLRKSNYRDNEAYIINTSGLDVFNNSQFIRDCIKEAFPKNEYEWQEDNEEFTEGLRGVYPFSNEDDWSVLNFFDTNPHRKKRLRELFEKSNEDNPKEWLVNFLKGNSRELNELVIQQRMAIQRSYDIENKVMSLITKNFTASQTKGSKKDRYSSIDGIDDDTGKTYQIKIVDSVNEIIDNENGEVTWEIQGKNSRLIDYRNKKELDYLAYFVPNNETVYVFDNEKYIVKNTDLVFHINSPKIYKS
jgi:hypothetical protein